MSLDTSFSAANEIASSVGPRLSQLLTEEDAKIQLIQRFLFETLGWKHEDLSAERKTDGGFSDFILSDGSHNAFVVEAKRLGRLNLQTQAKTKQAYKISGPALQDVLPAIVQAASYAAPEGIPLAVVTDGDIWIIFLPHVPNASYKERQAIVFPGLEAVLSGFAAFYELLSKAECRKGTFRLIFDLLHENRLTHSEPLAAPISKSDIHLEQKSSLAFDLDKVFSSFFSSLAGEDDPEMLLECFVETRESRIADFSLEKITANVLGNIQPLDNVDERLSNIVRSTVEGELGETIFLVGPSGAGKTTFLDRFFKKTLAPAIRDRCVVIKVDLRDASGELSTGLSWLTNELIRLVEEQLYASGYPEWNDLQALYQGEYVKRSKGVDSFLYQRDKNAFKEKFASYVEQQVAVDREGYLSRILRDIVGNRKKLPVIVVDNTDEFPLAYKEQIFQYLQSVRRNTSHCLLIFPATDRSAWSFSKAPIFNIYATKSFFLPTPSPREVFRKRIDYLKTKLKAPESDAKRAAYFTARGIKVTISNLEGFAAVLENIFVDQYNAAQRIGEIANYNMRKTLNLSKRIMTSAVIQVDDIIRSYLTGEIVTPSWTKFMNALLKGDYTFFKQDDEQHYIFPMFQVDSEVRQTPLIHLRVLLSLRDAHNSRNEDSERYISVGSLKKFFDLMSLSEASVEKSLISLLNSQMIEPYDLSQTEYSADQRFAITYSGLAHVDMALSNPNYFEQMALTTRIISGDIATQIRGTAFSDDHYSKRLEAVRSLFCGFLVTEDQKYTTIPGTPEFSNQSRLRADMTAQWMGIAENEKIEQQAPIEEGVVAIVEMFDPERGFGFVRVPNSPYDAYLGLIVLEAANISDVHEGDELLCDISRNQKGLYVSEVHEAVTPEPKTYRGTIVRLFQERSYGFVHVLETGSDAFLHLSVVPDVLRADLVEGMELTVEVKVDRSGRSQVRAVVH